MGFGYVLLSEGVVIVGVAGIVIVGGSDFCELFLPYVVGRVRRVLATRDSRIWHCHQFSTATFLTDTLAE